MSLHRHAVLTHTHAQKNACLEFLSSYTQGRSDFKTKVSLFSTKKCSLNYLHMLLGGEEDKNRSSVVLSLCEVTILDSKSQCFYRISFLAKAHLKSQFLCCTQNPKGYYCRSEWRRLSIRYCWNTV